jgi:hypothetical protein
VDEAGCLVDEGGFVGSSAADGYIGEEEVEFREDMRSSDWIIDSTSSIAISTFSGFRSIVCWDGE